MGNYVRTFLNFGPAGPQRPGRLRSVPLVPKTPSNSHLQHFPAPNGSFEIHGLPWFLKVPFVFPKGQGALRERFFTNRPHKSGPHVKKIPPPSDSYGAIWVPRRDFLQNPKIFSDFLGQPWPALSGPAGSGRLWPDGLDPSLPFAFVVDQGHFRLDQAFQPQSKSAIRNSAGNHL